MPSLDEIQNAQKPSDSDSPAPKRSHKKKAGGPGPGRPRKIPVLAPEMPEEEPRIRIDYDRMEFAINQWLALVAEIPCRLMKLPPLLVEERDALVSSGKGAIEYYFPDTAHPGMVFLATAATVYGSKLVQKQVDARAAKPENVPPPGDGKDGQRQDGPGETISPV